MNQQKQSNILAFGIAVLTSLVLLEGAALGYVWNDHRNLKNDAKLSAQTQQQSTTAQMNYTSYRPTITDMTTGKIYFPGINITIPETGILATSLVFNASAVYDAGSSSKTVDEVRVSTYTTAGAIQTQTQFNCSDLVRLKVENRANPYNPNEHAIGSVKLNDGRTLQIYSSHQPACQHELDVTGDKPDDIAALFKNASSY